MEILNEGKGELVGWHDPDEAREWVIQNKSRELKNKVMSAKEAVTYTVTVTAEGAEQEVSGEAVDYAGNTATTSAKVNIDKNPPAVSIAADPGILWPPNHKMVHVTISGSASDSLSDILTQLSFK